MRETRKPAGRTRETLSAMPNRPRAARRLSAPVAVATALDVFTLGMETPERIANHLGFLQLDLGDPEFRAHAAEHARRLDEHIAALLAEAVDAGEPAPDTDVPALARSVQVVHNGALITWGLHGSGDVREALHRGLDGLLAAHRTTGKGN